MLGSHKFLERFIMELRKTYSVVEMQGEHNIKIGTEETNLTIPFKPILQQYKLEPDFKRIVEEYSMIIQGILNQHKFAIDYSSVYPVLRNNNKNSEIKYFQNELFEDIGLYFVQDMGETIRFILETDAGIDFEKLEKEAFVNLNRLTNVLIKIDERFDIYSLKFITDYAASMILNKSIINQIHKKIGQDFLFCIPSASSLIIAKYHPQYIEMIKSLPAIDQDPNKISDEVYRCRNGFYTLVGEKRKTLLGLVR